MHSSLLFGLAGFAACAFADAVTTLPGFETTFLNNAAIRSPDDCNGKGSYITVKTFPADSPLDAQRCLQACKDETQFNLDHLGGRATCRFFNWFRSSKTDRPMSRFAHCTLRLGLLLMPITLGNGEMAITIPFRTRTHLLIQLMLSSSLSAHRI